MDTYSIGALFTPGLQGCGEQASNGHIRHGIPLSIFLALKMHLFLSMERQTDCVLGQRPFISP